MLEDSSKTVADDSTEGEEVSPLVGMVGMLGMLGMVGEVRLRLGQQLVVAAVCSAVAVEWR